MVIITSMRNIRAKRLNGQFLCIVSSDVNGLVWSDLEPKSNQTD